jgi:hypothetical protein
MADMGDFFTGGSYAYGAYVPPYGTKRGKARFELMKERIVAEWEEEQRNSSHHISPFVS